jgi:glycosyltransferase involved in cell wall biosynthesis
MTEGGSRLHFDIKKSLTNNPLVTIITVVFNGEQLIEETILSVLNQSYKDVEYIVIDGGSNDGTLKILSRYNDKIDYWLSEPDRGIYDAMNKGIALARGEWINFMNCGDRFASADVLNFFLEKNYEADIIFGDAIVQYQSFEATFKKVPLASMWRRIPFCHQASFTRANLMKQWNFNLQYKLSSDFDFIYRSYLNHKTFLYINKVICLFDFKTGATIKNAIKSIYERRDAVLSQNFSVTKWFYFNFLILYFYLITNLKKILGTKLSAWVTRLLRS